jgi:hypothetical protein
MNRDGTSPLFDRPVLGKNLAMLPSTPTVPDVAKCCVRSQLRRTGVAWKTQVAMLDGRMGRVEEVGVQIGTRDVPQELALATLSLAEPLLVHLGPSPQTREGDLQLQLRRPPVLTARHPPRRRRRHWKEVVDVNGVQGRRSQRGSCEGNMDVPPTLPPCSTTGPKSSNKRCR